VYLEKILTHFSELLQPSFELKIEYFYVSSRATADVFIGRVGRCPHGTHEPHCSVRDTVAEFLAEIVLRAPITP
jgi:hypothetical protein